MAASGLAPATAVDQSCRSGTARQPHWRASARKRAAADPAMMAFVIVVSVARADRDFAGQPTLTERGYWLAGPGDAGCLTRRSWRAPRKFNFQRS
jgi:hypothetical protein